MTQAVPTPQPPEEVIAYELHGNCYLNITYECTLRCKFCPKFNGEWTVQGYNLRIKHKPSVEEIVGAVGDVCRYNEIVFCGLGESTLRWDVMLQVAEQLKAKGAKTRLNTDGLANRVYERDVTAEMAGKIDALSISLNAQNEQVYIQHTRPKLENSFASLLDFIKQAKQYVPDITLTAINGLEGVDITACEKIAHDLGVKFRRRELDIVG